MKKSRKLMSILLIVAMLFTLAAPAMAAGEGKITIDDAVKDQTYSVYRILDLSFDEANKSYVYTVNTDWSGFFANSAPGAAYVTITNGYVTWNAAESAAAEFAKRAQAYAETNNIEPAAEPIKAASTTVVFDNLDLGYYLVDTTLGALCSLDTTDKEVTMKEKNEVPEVTKEVEEDSKVGKENVNPWGATNDADINQVVNYKAVIKVKAGAEKYILHDTMSAGLDFIPTSVEVTVDGKLVATGNYQVKTEGLDDNCTFEVIFSDDYITGLAAGLKNSDDGTAAAEKEIIVTYSATLNENAYVGSTTPDNPGNTNKVKLQYNDSYTTEDITTTYTWKMDVVKYTVKAVVNTDGTPVLENEKPKTEEVKLAGATFKLSTDEDGNNVINFHSLDNDVYKVCADATCANADNHVSTITTDEDGAFQIIGLDADTYYLHETVAPEGYNKLANPITVVIEHDGKVKVNDNVVDKVKVENNTGAELPETGGIGTTIFYVAGGALVLGAAVLLVTRRRMAE